MMEIKNYNAINGVVRLCLHVQIFFGARNCLAPEILIFPDIFGSCLTIIMETYGKMIKRV